MAAIVLAADSTTVVLNGRAITAFVAGDILTLTPAADQTSQVVGSDGGVAINNRADGNVYDLLMRIQRFTDDDVFLNSAINQRIPVLFSGSIKEDFQRDGVDYKESWSLENGSFTTKPTHTKNDMDGNALVEYTLRFRRAVRTL